MIFIVCGWSIFDMNPKCAVLPRVFGNIKKYRFDILKYFENLSFCVCFYTHIWNRSKTIFFLSKRYFKIFWVCASFCVFVLENHEILRTPRSDIFVYRNDVLCYRSDCFVLSNRRSCNIYNIVVMCNVAKYETVPKLIYVY